MSATPHQQAATPAPASGSMPNANGSNAVRLDPESVAALATALAPLVAERLADRLASATEATSTAGLIDATEVARRLGMDRGWVYEHAAELGAVRLGDGPRPRLRFDPEHIDREARERATAGGPDQRTEPSRSRTTPSDRRRRRASAAATVPEPLPIGADEARRERAERRTRAAQR